MRQRSFTSAAIGVALLAWIVGCGDSAKTVSPSPQDKTSGPSDPAGKQIRENLAQLSDADRAAAEKQHHCPVSGELLGSMGVPIQVDVQDRKVWICCEACREKLLAEPEKYLAKIK